MVHAHTESRAGGWVFYQSLPTGPRWGLSLKTVGCISARWAGQGAPGTANFILPMLGTARPGDLNAKVLTLAEQVLLATEHLSSPGSLYLSYLPTCVCGTGG